MHEDMSRLLTSLSQQVGELRGEVRQILKKLESMEKKYNGYSERTIRLEEITDELRKAISNHLHNHEQKKGWNVQIKAAVIGGIAGGSVGLVGGLIIRMIVGG